MAASTSTAPLDGAMNSPAGLVFDLVNADEELLQLNSDIKAEIKKMKDAQRNQPASDAPPTKPGSLLRPKPAPKKLDPINPAHTHVNMRRLLNSCDKLVANNQKQLLFSRS